MPPVPPGPAVVRAGTPVNASFDKTWNAVIDVFAERNILIKTIDKASGLIVAEPGQVPSDGNGWLADCGTVAGGRARVPTSGTWNVLVRGDSAPTNVKATVMFISTSPGLFGGSVTTECSTKGKWETAFESDVKQRAERPATSSSTAQSNGACAEDAAARDGEDMAATVAVRKGGGLAIGAGGESSRTIPL